MNYKDHEDKIISLIQKSADQKDAGEAMKFSQAACNSANALNALLAGQKNQ